ncbi:hypothetical protein [Pectinatus sottacetonis]|uniref:hypothetical protein n=1 Tax=Pectinatus sottacetonis TaxID=1002795 RepID=UPI0018C5B612|nr:hypothetical protein [Pectinatus sottacetonis]
MLAKKLLSYIILMGLVFNFTASTHVYASSPSNSDNQKNVSSADILSLEKKVEELTQRLNTLENQLQEKKSIKKISSKQNNDHKMIWSGSTKNGYMYDETGSGKVKSEVKLFGDTNIDDGYHVRLGLKFKSTTSEPSASSYPSEKNKIKLEAANISKNFTKNLKLTVGTQKVEVGEGLWLDKGGINAFKLNYNLSPNDKLQAVYGRNSQDYLVNDTNKLTDPPSRTRLLKLLDYKHNFNKKAYAGIYLGAQQPEKYIGFYGKTPLSGKWSISGEYVINTNKNKPEQAVTENKIHLDKKYTSTAKIGYGYDYTGANDTTRGYVLGLHYGKAKKTGDFATSLEFINVDQNTFMDNNYTDWDDYIDSRGFKGVGLIFNYAVSKASKLSLSRYWAHTKPDKNNVDDDGNSAAKENYNTVYLKLTTKF